MHEGPAREVLTIRRHAAENTARQALAGEESEWAAVQHPCFACGATMASKSKIILRELDQYGEANLTCAACKRSDANISEEQRRQLLNAATMISYLERQRDKEE